jgi:uncharacterized protein (DUF433 family)
MLVAALLVVFDAAADAADPAIKASRMRPDDLIVNRSEGEAWLAENYELPIETLRQVLRFHDRHKLAP